MLTVSALSSTHTHGYPHCQTLSLMADTNSTNPPDQVTHCIRCECPTFTGYPTEPCETPHCGHAFGDHKQESRPPSAEHCTVCDCPKFEGDPSGRCETPDCGHAYEAHLHPPTTTEHEPPKFACTQCGCDNFTAPPYISGWATCRTPGCGHLFQVHARSRTPPPPPPTHTTETPPA